MENSPGRASNSTAGASCSPAGLQLCERLGLGERLVFRPAGRIDILDRGRLLPLPAGFALAVPTRARPVLASPLLSWRGKLRAIAEPWVAPRVAAPSTGHPADESVASYVRRRFGEEFYRRISEPVVGGLFMADTEELSLGASFPRFASQERSGKPGRQPVGGPPSNTSAKAGAHAGQRAGAKSPRRRPPRSTAASARSSPPWPPACPRDRCG